MKIKDYLEIPAGFSGVLHPNGNCTLISVRRRYNLKKGRSVVSVGYDYLEGINRLKTPDNEPIKTCGGIMYQNGHYVLIHALWQPLRDYEDSRTLLRITKELSLDGEGEKLDALHLCTTNPSQDFENVLGEVFGEVPVKRHMRFGGKAGIVEQDIAIGKDVLDFGV